MAGTGIDFPGLACRVAVDDDVGPVEDYEVRDPDALTPAEA